MIRTINIKLNKNKIMNKIIKCKYPKNYNLTLDKEYKVEEESSDFYTLKNDNDIIVKYRTNLFINKVESEEDIISSLKITDNHRIRLLKNGEPILLDFTDKLNYLDTAISCGIYQLSGINELIGDIRDTIINIFGTQETYSNLIQDIFELQILDKIEKMLEIEDILYILFSTNTNNNFFYLQEPVMDDLCKRVALGINPNTENEIILWLYKNE